ncbi:hypothetical protein [Erwinia mallotivora]|uniref:Membrane protein n=1 Tax=Erwinia mallotivora TaxID=69222 RepID=A0A014MG67_9GAMM|nr:hypothetical protein [Erwinia mallotivora]EXU77099.1 membrane protein [Erwinia mallotivora]
MDKAHFYERLTRWRHLRFNDVTLRERADTPAWNKKYEVYILDNTRLSAQLYIRTSQPEENTALIMAQYQAWLDEYNAMQNPQMAVIVAELSPTKRALMPDSCHRVPAPSSPFAPLSVPRHNLP